jgi:hypothetical protein
MGYFNDVFEIIGLKDNAYKNVANDAGAAKRLVLYMLVSSYVMFTLVMMVLLFFIGIILVATGTSLGSVLGYSLLIILFLPPVSVCINIFFAWLNHLVALLCGGKAKSFWDFFKVYQYPKPLVILLAFIPLVNMVVSLYGIWDFLILYKSLINVHKLEQRTAMWFVIIKAIITTFIAVAWLIFILWLMAAAATASAAASASLTAATTPVA